MSIKNIPAGLLMAALCCLGCKTPIPETTFHDLKANGIAFRLHDAKGKVAALKAAGLPEEAENTARETSLYNRAVVQFFRDGFTFCPVYFFYAGQTDSLKQRKPVLLDDQLRPAAIPLPEKVFIADYGFNGIEPGEAHIQEKFYIEGTEIEIRPVFRLSWKNADKLRPKDIAKFDRVLRSGKTATPK